MHSTSSFEDDKITLLFIKFGYEGLGLFYTILEKLAKQEKPVNERVLKKQLFVGKKLQKCWDFLKEIELISSENEEIFNKKLTKFGENISEKREKISERVSKHRANQQVVENVTRYINPSNDPNYNLNITKEETKELSKESKDSFHDSEVLEMETEEIPVDDTPPGITESSAPAAEVKKPAKSRRKDPSEYTIVTKIKIAVYEMNKDYRWNGTDGSAAKKLAASIKEVWVKNTGMEPTDDEILKYFRKMIPFIPKYWDGIWDVKGLNSEFNKISSAMKKPVTHGKTIDAMIEIREISEKRLREGRVKTFNDQ